MDREDLIYMIRDGATIPQTHAIIDHIDQLERENKQLKEQYCERTDCGGRLGNSKKVEKYESVLDEIREIIKQNMSSCYDFTKAFYEIENILDKVKE